MLIERTLGRNQVEMKEAPGGQTVAKKMLTVSGAATINVGNAPTTAAMTAATTVNPELRPEVKKKVRRLLI